MEGWQKIVYFRIVTPDRPFSLNTTPVQVIALGRRAACCLLLLLFVQAAPVPSSPLVHAEQLTQALTEHYLKSFPLDAAGTDGLLQVVDPSEQPRLKRMDIRPPALDPALQQRVVLQSILSKSKAYAQYAQEALPVLNKYAWEDLQLLCGHSTSPGTHLLSRVDCTHSVLGRSVLATWLVTPTPNIAVLQGRQTVVQQLLRHPAHLKALRDHLLQYRAAEQSVLSFWTKSDPLYAKSFVDYMNSEFYSAKHPERNLKAGRLEWNKRFWRDFWGIQLQVIYPAFSAGVASLVALPSRSRALRLAREEYGRVPADMRRSINANYLASVLSPVPGLGIWAEYRSYQVRGVQPPSMVKTYIWNGVNTALWLWRVVDAWQLYQEYSRVLRSLALRMADVQRLVRVMQHVDHYIANNPTLATTYGPHLQHVRVLLAEANNKTELGRLLRYLKELNYQHWSYFLHNAGKLLASFKLFLKHKDAFVDALYELGQLDAYLSTAQLVRESKTRQVQCHYSFPQYLPREQKSTPYLQLKGMWSPFLVAEQAVPNDVTMGGEVRNMLVTGPNAGGKSTFLIGTTVALLLSQTLGIVPAKSATLTPFNKLSTYIRVRDDIVAGKSLFVTELERAYENIAIVKKLGPGEFSFSCKDELFSGTNPREGEAAAYSVLRYAGQYKNALSMVATHFPRVMLLEDKAKEGGFRNYKVFIKLEKDAHGKTHIGYTYKVVPGRAKQVIALALLEEQGYDPKVLRWANDMVQHPEKYKAKF